MSEQPQYANRAEEQARKKGYTGTWPPDLTMPKTTPDFVKMVHEVVDGDHRTSRAKVLGRYALRFASELEPREMRAIAKAMVGIASRSSNTVKARISAIESCIALLMDMNRLLPELYKTRQTELQSHIEELCDAFLDEVGEDGFGTMARELLKVNKKAFANVKDASQAVYVFRRVQKMLTKMLEMSITASRKYRNPEPEIDDNDPRAKRAEEELAKMERQIKYGLSVKRTA